MADAILHKEYRDKLALLKPEQQIAVVYAMMDYAEGNDVSLDDPAAAMAFAFIKDRIDSDNAKYKNRVSNGHKGGRPKTEQNQTEPTETKQNLTEPNETEQNQTEPNESKKSILISKSISKSISIPTGKREGIERKAPAPLPAPTLEEVKAYADEIKSKVNPEKFYWYYQGRGWKRGEYPIEDWKAVFQHWQTTEDDKGNPIRAVPTKKNGFHFEGERKTDYDAILREEQLALAEQIRAAGGEP